LILNEKQVTKLILCIFFIFLLIDTACGFAGMGGGGGNTTTIAPEFTVSGNQLSVKLDTMSGFTPKTLTIKSGDTIIWTNAGTYTVTLVSSEGLFEDKLLNNAKQMSYTIVKTGTFNFYLKDSNGLSGSIIVEPTGGTFTPASTIYATPIATPVLTSTIIQSTTVTTVAPAQQISVTVPPTVKENAQINLTLIGGGAILVVLLGGIILRMRKTKKNETRDFDKVKSDIHMSDESNLKPNINTSYIKPALEILRGYSVLQNNDIKFGIRLTNKTGFVVTDADVILDYTKSLFSTKDTEIQHLGNITPTGARTATYLLKPLGCIHNEQINALITYKDHTGKKQTIHMRPKEVHCVCPFLKEKPMSEGEYSRLAAGSEFVQEGISFKGITVDDLAKFMGETCRHMLHKVREYDIEGKKVIYLSGESVGEKAYYLLTAVIQDHKGLTQVVLRAHSDKKYGLNGFMNEMADSLRHLVGSVQNAKEIGIIENTQVINIIDSVVQRTSFNMGDDGNAQVNIKDSVVQRSKIGKEE
jgi:plastocyanin